MSNPELYDYWEAQAKKLYEVIDFKRFVLSMDEVRNGGGCLSCRNRNISMARILGDCITRQHAIFKKIDPEIEVLIWSDMIDLSRTDSMRDSCVRRCGLRMWWKRCVMRSACPPSTCDAAAVGEIVRVWRRCIRAGR
ncbi:MAG: hypothetical protein ACC628_19725 [Pirellulaceae bacterium]